MDADRFPKAWLDAIGTPDLERQVACVLEAVEEQRGAGVDVHPPRGLVFAALEMTPPDVVRAVILGQDPYHHPGQAHGLAFSVPDGVAKPPTLRNILKVWSQDTGNPIPTSGCLEAWARHGVLLLNSSLTVRGGVAGSHAGTGWHSITGQIVATVASMGRPIAFLLWGKHAQSVAGSVGKPNVVLHTSHPSPLAARRGFSTARPFTGANDGLKRVGGDPIDWRL